MLIFKLHFKLPSGQKKKLFYSLQFHIFKAISRILASVGFTGQESIQAGTQFMKVNIFKTWLYPF